ncbi:MAG: DUF1015 domain-containing protein [Oscillospiraceae bacterium]|nr:DUF1015 domain-containing protein [Oscillospiraceae bacterium]
MAEIRAFRGLRYDEKAGDIGSLCCPPYDIISKEERLRYLEKNPYNIIRLELPEALSDSPNLDVYATAGQFLRDWLGRGILKNEPNECIYIYEMEFEVYGQKKSVTGFISLIKLEEFSKGIVLPHEETLSKAKTDRFNLMKATNCNFSQIYSLYNDQSGEIAVLLNEAKKESPTSSFTDGDGVTHKLWVIDTASPASFIGKLTALMAPKKVYIADGHHRYETALNYRNSHSAQSVGSNERGTADYVPMMLVNMENDGLVVFPTHRIVRDLGGYEQNEILNKCEEFFEITPNLNRENAQNTLNQAYAKGEKAFALYSGGNNFVCLKLKCGDGGAASIMNEFMPGASEALRGLDVSVLHTLVLERIFGIDKENMANQVNLTYTRNTDEAISAVDDKRANCCFLLNPTRVDEISGVAAAGEKMPQKSTYFYPKLTTGLVMNQIVK